MAESSVDSYMPCGVFTYNLWKKDCPERFPSWGIIQNIVVCSLSIYVPVHLSIILDSE